MNLNTGTALAAIIGTAVTVLGAIWGLYRQARSAAAAQAEAKQSIYNRGFVDGKASRDAEVALLTSQRDDARNARDRFSDRADQFEQRYDTLRDRRDNP